ncbi:unnamed protein product [Owenia fusiformis]|nr:unnamed protein product [Owenia fusiformis]
MELEKQRVMGLLKKYEHKLGRDKIRGHTHHEVHHRPGECIITYAKNIGAHMILMASRGHGKVRQTILGSISGYVLHHAPMPVLIIPKPHHHHHMFGCHDNKEIKVAHNGATYDKLAESVEETEM